MLSSQMLDKTEDVTTKQRAEPLALVLVLISMRVLRTDCSLLLWVSRLAIKITRACKTKLWSVRDGGPRSPLAMPSCAFGQSPSSATPGCRANSCSAQALSGRGSHALSHCYPLLPGRWQPRMLRQVELVGMSKRSHLTQAEYRSTAADWASQTC